MLHRRLPLLSHVNTCLCCHVTKSTTTGSHCNHVPQLKKFHDYLEPCSESLAAASDVMSLLSIPDILGVAHFRTFLVLLMQVDLIVALRSEALQLNETLRLAQLDKTEGEGQLQLLKDKIAAKNLEGER